MTTCIELEHRVTVLEQKVESLAEQVKGIRTDLAKIVGLCTEIREAVGVKRKRWCNIFY